MIEFQLDSGSGVATYLQLVQQVNQALQLGLLEPGDRLPTGARLPGERFEQSFGGKGANQAVMAAKLGAEVTMVTKLGDDIFGRDYLENFRRLGLDTRHVLVTAGETAAHDDDAFGLVGHGYLRSQADRPVRAKNSS